MTQLRLDPIDPETIPDAALLERMRAERNHLLTQSDWTQTADNPMSNTAAWATWRQQLRDFPATWTPADTVDFPDPPA